MKKRYLLDTNVLMRNPRAIFKFEDNDVCICTTTLRELDKYKTHLGEVGFNAREAIRTLYSLQIDKESIESIPINDGTGTFSIVKDVFLPLDENFDFFEKVADDIIIATAKELNAILITSDIAMFLKAKACSCETEVFKNEQASKESMEYLGIKQIYASSEFINKLYKDKEIEYDNEVNDVYENQYLIIKCDDGSSQSVICRCHNGKLLKIKDGLHPSKITPRNVAQKCAIDALMAPVDEIPLVILKGPAGTAKTFLSLACGLQLVDDKQINRILALRPNIKFDEDIGFLKGDEMDKITPLIRPCFDNLEAILAPTVEATEYARMKVEKLFENGTVEAEALAYLRGRSIANSFVLVDEAQNSTPNQMLGIISRAGVGSKIVITGDPEQIDNPKVDKKNNGLVYAAEKMLGSDLCAQVGFTNEECVRSPLAAEAAKRLAL